MGPRGRDPSIGSSRNGVCDSYTSMIPTIFRVKLPRDLSYPIGARAISQALSDAPHLDSLSVMFSDAPVRRKSEFRRLLTERSPYRIMAAEFRPARRPGFVGSHDMLEWGLYDESWQLTVYPVLSELRQPANRLLRERALPLIARWLGGCGRAGWTRRWHRLDLVFDPADGSLAAKESSRA